MKKINLFIMFSIILTYCSCTTMKISDKQSKDIEGSWELNHITNSEIAFNDLFRDEKPTIIFDLKKNMLSGGTSCNRYSGELDRKENKINFKKDIALTKRYCPGDGEKTYLSALQKTNSYLISPDGKTLNFLLDGAVLMSFLKK
ncbi:heat shock protein HslJ [Flavobacterium sp. PL11]|uniref:META domain-containing protein n=1 Tax=Flavobacterium sp. PL11 TaxID=3071717 RepID=UPI002E0013E9|nr:heat shock protein HslJ [Flavobacterium sp. PL11]